MINIVRTKLEGVLLITPERTEEDFRGEIVEMYNQKVYKEAGIEVDFVQDNIMTSSKHVLRGFHGDSKTWKLVSCLYGKFYLVVANCDEESKSFGRWEAFVLSDRNRKQVLVPPKFGLAHLVLSDVEVFSYKLSEYHDPRGQFTYKWNDPRFKVWWPIKNPILSRRDEEGKYVD